MKEANTDYIAEISKRVLEIQDGLDTINKCCKRVREIEYAVKNGTGYALIDEIVDWESELAKTLEELKKAAKELWAIKDPGDTK